MDQLITQASAPASAHTPEAVAARVQRMARSYAQARLTDVSGYWRGGLRLA